MEETYDIHFAEYSEAQALRALSGSIDEALDRDTVDELGDATYDTITILVNGKVHAFKLTGSSAAAMIEFIKKLCELDCIGYPWPKS